MAKQLGFTVNLDQCIGCHSCEMGCKNFNALDPAMFYRHVHDDFPEDLFGVPTRVHVSLACNHCADPACLAACPVKAYSKRDKDGIVIHDPSRCIGCKMCIAACPYNVPQFNEEKHTVEKCHMCYQRVDDGLKPGCVSTCPVGAIDIVDISKIDEAAFEKQIPGFPDQKLTKSSTRFIKPQSVKRIIPEEV